MAPPDRPPAHPAKFSKPILAHIEQIVTAAPDGTVVCDPFAGVFTIGSLARPGVRIVGIEIEPEWANRHPDVIVGDSATSEPWEQVVNTYGAPTLIVTSPAYGNRMADNYGGSPSDWENGGPAKRRLTYRTYLGRPLTAGSGAGMQWGTTYRQLHAEVYGQSFKHSTDDAIFVCNIKDHYRGGVRQEVPDWHLETLTGLGWVHVSTIEIGTSHYGHGANRDARLPELMLTFQKGRS